MNRDLLTVEEIAASLRVKKSWVYVHADELGAYRLGKYLRFTWERVVERLNRQGHPFHCSHDHQIAGIPCVGCGCGKDKSEHKTVA